MASSAIEEARRNTDLAYLQEQNSVLTNNLELLEERMADVVMALDNVGWKPLGENVDATEIPLLTILEVAQTTRALCAINPLIKRGLAVRQAYIWGKGIKFEGIDVESDDLVTTPTNWKSIFSPQAQAEIETVQGTDGNLFVLLTKTGPASPKDTIKRIPVTQITGTITDPENPEDIWFYKREWDITEEQASGVPSTVRKIAYYPAADYDQDVNGKPRMYRNIPVDYNSVILHKAVNKQVGWKWGVPDLMSVIFWTKAYKEFLENSASLVKAYARFAFKVTTTTRQGVAPAAMKVAQQPTRDPMTGVVSNVGGTAVMGMGTTLSPVGKTGSAVDFEAGLPLAAMVAAGLDIPLTTLTSDGGSSNRSGAETLTDPTIKSMEARQKLWTDFYQQVFKYFGKSVKVQWEAIESDATYRQVQAVLQASELNVLSAQEVRDLLVAAFRIQNDNKLPTKEELGLLTLVMDNAAEQSLQAQQAQAADAALQGGTKPGAPAKGAGGKQPATSNPSYGDNSHRDAAGQHAYTGGRNSKNG